MKNQTIFPLVWNADSYSFPDAQLGLDMSGEDSSLESPLVPVERDVVWSHFVSITLELVAE